MGKFHVVEQGAAWDAGHSETKVKVKVKVNGMVKVKVKVRVRVECTSLWLQESLVMTRTMARERGWTPRS